MSTLPLHPDPGPASHRAVAESFGDDAARYDRARPTYPQAVADGVLAGLPGRHVLDVGIGTGISALPFRAAGAEVSGVEVDPRMAEVARARGFAVEVARFEEWEPGGRMYDAVVAGQAWHWVDPVAGAAKAAAVLRPRGRLALFWNVADVEPDVATAFADVYRSVPTGLPFAPWTGPATHSYGPILTRTEEGIRSTGSFTEPTQRRLGWRTTVSRDEWLDQVPTAGGHSRMAPERLAELLEGLGRVVDAHGGSLALRYTTLVVVADRTERAAGEAPDAASLG